MNGWLRREKVRSKSAPRGVVGPNRSRLHAYAACAGRCGSRQSVLIVGKGQAGGLASSDADRRRSAHLYDGR